MTTRDAIELVSASDELVLRPVEVPAVCENSLIQSYAIIRGGLKMDRPLAKKLVKQLEKMDFSKPDRINDDLFNRYIWYTIK